MRGHVVRAQYKAYYCADNMSAHTAYYCHKKS